MNASLTERLRRAKAAIDEADFVVIGGGAGLSAAAGLTYSGARFTENFQPFIRRYGMTDMYSAAFTSFATQEEKWAYWARHIHINRFAPPASALYRRLFTRVRDKAHFVITTNVDSQFAKAGFAAERIFEVQGNYGELQCAVACHETCYDNQAQVAQWLSHTVDCRIPAALVPRCPVCGGHMAMHLRTDACFVQDARWRAARARYADFVEQAQQGAALFLELGVGYNTPSIIRYPFERMTFRNPRARLIRLNRDHPGGAAENRDKTLGFDEDMADILDQL